MSSLILFLIGIMVAVGAGAADAQEPSMSCLKKCGSNAVSDVRTCRDRSRRCVLDHYKDPLKIGDYCLNEFLGACESVARGRYETCLAEKCGADIAALRADALTDAELADPPTQLCTTDDGDVVNDILTDIQTVVDDTWETIACDTGLCPLENVYTGTINVGCDANTGLAAALDTFCLGVTIGTCQKFYVDVTVQSIDGLQYLDYSDTAVSTINGSAGTQICPYSSNANKGLDLDCSFSGTGGGDVSIKADHQLDMDVTEFKVKVKCDDGVAHPTFVLYDDGFTCTASTATGRATFGYCAGDCLHAPGGVVSYLKVPNNDDIHLEPGNTKCDFDGSKFAADILDDFEDAFEPLFKKQIANALKAPMKEVVNEIIPALPYPPNTCTKS